jgi:hypothetical protein
MSHHLTHEQLSNLLIADPTVCDLDLPTTASDLDTEAHLLDCGICAAELDGLRQSLACFREAVTVHAAAQPHGLPQTAFHLHKAPPMRYRHLALWSACAAALVVAITIPVGVRSARPQAPIAVPSAVAAPALAAVAPPHTAESDEALLAGIEQDLSSSIPTSMQPLADPLPSAQTSSTSK